MVIAVLNSFKCCPLNRYAVSCGGVSLYRGRNLADDSTHGRQAWREPPSWVLDLPCSRGQDYRGKEPGESAQQKERLGPGEWVPDGKLQKDRRLPYQILRNHSRPRNQETPIPLHHGKTLLGDDMFRMPSFVDHDNSRSVEFVRFFCSSKQC